ncbi:hypothetical protein CRG98_029926 [Punica granatum]|uniref:Uncharacterized protein n=1 Tax=Punica granatum TaxID=22663 RepID=A0A2I0J0A5_PUNGR|nr:hypothetical protein CRG98_029926 [Punica granatum]
MAAALRIPWEGEAAARVSGGAVESGWEDEVNRTRHCLGPHSISFSAQSVLGTTGLIHFLPDPVSARLALLNWVGFGLKPIKANPARLT